MIATTIINSIRVNPLYLFIACPWGWLSTRVTSKSRAKNVPCALRHRSGSDCPAEALDHGLVVAALPCLLERERQAASGAIRREHPVAELIGTRLARLQLMSDGASARRWCTQRASGVSTARARCCRSAASSRLSARSCLPSARSSAPSCHTKGSSGPIVSTILR